MVIITDHKNKGICSIFILFGRIFRIVVIKLIEPKIEDTPAKWSLKMARSTDIPEWEILDAKGG